MHPSFARPTTLNFEFQCLAEGFCQFEQARCGAPLMLHSNFGQIYAEGSILQTFGQTRCQFFCFPMILGAEIPFRGCSFALEFVILQENWTNAGNTQDQRE
jgi:hypothetical protein